MNTNSKFLFSLLILTPLILTGGFVFAHNGESHGHDENHHNPNSIVKENLESINAEYLARVKPIFQKSCVDCHSGQTNYPWYSKIPGLKGLIQDDIKEARTHLDLSNDFPFSGHGTPRKDLEAIRDEINEGAMPPMRYSLMHPGSKLTDEEKKVVLNWVTSGLSKIPTQKDEEPKHGH